MRRREQSKAWPRENAAIETAALRAPPPKTTQPRRGRRTKTGRSLRTPPEAPGDHGPGAEILRFQAPRPKELVVQGPVFDTPKRILGASGKRAAGPQTRLNHNRTRRQGSTWTLRVAMPGRRRRNCSPSSSLPSSMLVVGLA
eukprot:10412221-Alexandrium_andersonii.AAC.1